MLSVTEIAAQDPKQWDSTDYHRHLTNVDSAARSLEVSGLVYRQSVTDRNTRVFEIQNPNYTLVHPRIQRSPSVQGLYAFMAERFQSGHMLFGFEEALNYVVDWVQARDPKAHPQDIRIKLSGTFNRLNTVPGLKRFGLYNNGRLTKVGIKPNYEAPLEELIEIILGIDNQDPALLERGRQLAHDIIGSVDQTTTLMDKAHRFSSNANKVPAVDTMDRIETILADMDHPADRLEVLKIYGTRYGRKLSDATIGMHLRELVKAGRVKAANKPKKDSLKTRRSVYSIIHDVT